MNAPAPNGFRPEYIEAALRGEVDALGRVQRGERNERAFKAAASLASLGIREGEIIRALKPAAEANGMIKDDGSSSFYSTVKNGVAAGQKSPRKPPRDVPTVLQFAPKAVAPLSKSAFVADFPPRTPPADDGKPRFYTWGSEGPPMREGELRRHVYTRAQDVPVRVKIKNAPGSPQQFTQWFRVRDVNGGIGWQAMKPEGYRDVPFVGSFDPFDRELQDDTIYWPEGEKDVETLGKVHLPAFTFGGCGDGAPDGIGAHLAGRDVVILADNDDAGRKHAERKAEIAHAAGAARIRIVHFPELADRADVSDFVAAGGSANDIEARADAAPLWSPPVPAATHNVVPDRELIVRCASAIEPEKVEWLWPGRVAVGKPPPRPVVLAFAGG